MSRNRLAYAAGVGLIVASLAAILPEHEGMTTKAVIPVKGDVPTIGTGITTYPNGSRVRLGDTITPAQNRQFLQYHLEIKSAALAKCVKRPVSLMEGVLLTDHAYQYGPGKTCASYMVRAINRGDYTGHCAGYLKYRFVAGYDCSTPGNKRCAGVWKRSQWRFNECTKEQALLSDEPPIIAVIAENPPYEPQLDIIEPTPKPWWQRLKIAIFGLPSEVAE